MARRFLRASAMVLSGAMVLCAMGESRLGRIEPGRSFPELSLPRLEDGTAGSLADYRGRRVLLLVFASW